MFVRYEIMKETKEAFYDTEWTTDELLCDYNHHGYTDQRLVGTYEREDEARAAFKEECRLATTMAREDGAHKYIEYDVVVLDRCELNEDENYLDITELAAYAEPFREA